MNFKTHTHIAMGFPKFPLVIVAELLLKLNWFQIKRILRLISNKTQDLRWKGTTWLSVSPLVFGSRQQGLPVIPSAFVVKLLHNDNIALNQLNTKMGVKPNKRDTKVCD